MSPEPGVLTRAEVDAALAELPDWRARLDGLHTVHRAPSSIVAIDLVHAIGRTANDLDHHPDLDWRYDHIFLRTRTHSAGRRTTARDVELARQISALAADARAEPRPEVYRDMLIAVDTSQPETIHDTWAAVLGMQPWGDTDSLADPWGRLPAVWFQETATPNPNRLHLDVFVEDPPPTLSSTPANPLVPKDSATTAGPASPWSATATATASASVPTSSAAEPNRTEGNTATTHGRLAPPTDRRRKCS